MGSTSLSLARYIHMIMFYNSGSMPKWSVHTCSEAPDVHMCVCERSALFVLGYTATVPQEMYVLIMGNVCLARSGKAGTKRGGLTAR